MRPDCVVVLAPLLDDDLGFLQTVEDLAVEQLIAELTVEGLAVAVLPGAAWFDEQRLCSNLRQPIAHDLRRHLSAVVRPDVLGHAPHQHDVGHRLKHTEAVDPARYPDGQAFAGILINQRHQPELAAIVGLGLHEVVAPHMIASLRPEPDAGSIVEPEPASRPLFLGYFEPLTAPDPLHPVAAHVPPGIVQQ